MNITFEQIYNCGEVWAEFEHYHHIHYPQMLSRYDSNYIQFHKMPNIAQFEEAAQYLMNFHKSNGQDFVKFKFPANEVPPKSLLAHIHNYNVGFLELYRIDPKDFKGTESKAVVKVVSEPELPTFLKLQYEEDLRFGEDFAKEKQALLLRQREQAGHTQLIAYLDDVPCGFVELIEREQTVEIDNLFVLETARGQGVASQIQRFVMQQAETREVILVADGEDTPRDMYKKQGYRYAGFQYEAVKIGI